MRISNIILIALMAWYALPGLAMGYENMVCSSGEGLRCLTEEAGHGKARITCQSPQGSGIAARIHDCGLAVRDWAVPSPYAHTSRIWLCISGDSRLHLFDRDFTADNERCAVLCGPCKAGWLAIPEAGR